MDIIELKAKTMPELMDIAEQLEIPGVSSFRKQDLIFKILEAKTEKSGLVYAEGIL